MTVSNMITRWAPFGDGVVKDFGYSGRIFAASDLVVYVDGGLKVIGMDYTVSGVDLKGGGNVSFLVAPAAGANIVIIRVVPLIQPTAYPSGGPFPSGSVEKAQDRLTILVQQLSSSVVRKIGLSDSDNYAGSLDLPTGTDATAKGLMIDSTGLSLGPAAGEVTNAQGYAVSAQTAQTNATTQAGIATTKAMEAAGSAATALAATVGKYDTKIAISSVDSPYTVASMTVDTLLNVNTTGGNVVVNLPAASGETDNRLLGINKIGALNTVTINPNGTDTIGGAASFTQYDDTEWADLYLDKAGADWLLGNLSYTNAGPGLKKLGSTISIDPTTTPQIATDQSWTGSQRATFVAANTGAYDMNAGQNFTTITTGPTVLSFTNITNGQSGLIDFNNTLAGAVTVAGTYITGSGTLLTTISAAGVYTLGYYSPDGVNVRITNSGLQGVPA